MLIKLIKHELKSSYRNYLPIFSAVLLATLLMWTQSYAETMDAFFLLISLTMFLIFTLYILVFVNIFKSLGDRIFGKPGYLLFTIPAKTHQIIISRVVANFIWIILATIVAYLPFIVMVDVITNIIAVDPALQVNVVDLLLQLLGVDVNSGALDITLSILGRIFDFVLIIGVTLFSYAFVNSNYKGERQKLIIFLMFIGVYFIFSTITNTSLFISTREATNSLGEVYEELYRTTLQMGLLVVFKIAVSLGLFIWSNNLIEHKLELE